MAKEIRHPYSIGEIITIHQLATAFQEEAIYVGLVLWREPDNKFGYRIKVRLAGVSDPTVQITSLFRHNDGRWIDRGWDTFVRIEQAGEWDRKTFCREIPEVEQARLIEIERKSHLAKSATQ